jgi:hypothetical protein
MRLPNAENAYVDDRKLRAYCLNPQHFRGQHKARMFKDALGIGAEGADWLKARLLDAARTQDAQPGQTDSFGERYVLDFPVQGLSRTVTIRSCWIIRSAEDFPRLTTCFPV